MSMHFAASGRGYLIVSSSRFAQGKIYLSKLQSAVTVKVGQSHFLNCLLFHPFRDIIGVKTLDQINYMNDWLQALIEDYGEDVTNFYLSNVCNDPQKFYFFYQGTQDHQPDDHLNFIYDPKTKSLFQNFDIS